MDDRSVGAFQHRAAQGGSRKLLATDTYDFEEDDSLCDSVVLILNIKDVATVADLEHAEVCVFVVCE